MFTYQPFRDGVSKLLFTVSNIRTVTETPSKTADAATFISNICKAVQFGCELTRLFSTLSQDNLRTLRRELLKIAVTCDENSKEQDFLNAIDQFVSVIVPDLNMDYQVFCRGILRKRLESSEARKLIMVFVQYVATVITATTMSQPLPTSEEFKQEMRNFEMQQMNKSPSVPQQIAQQTVYTLPDPSAQPKTSA